MPFSLSLPSCWESFLHNLKGWCVATGMIMACYSNFIHSRCWDHIASLLKVTVNTWRRLSLYPAIIYILLFCYYCALVWAIHHCSNTHFCSHLSSTSSCLCFLFCRGWLWTGTVVISWIRASILQLRLWCLVSVCLSHGDSNGSLAAQYLNETAFVASAFLLYPKRMI